MNMSNDKTILVTGATGNQGGAVTRHLLKDGWRVRALSRNPDKPAAQSLKAQGVEVVQGNLNDTTSLQKAMTGVYAVFSVQTMMEEGVEAEARQGKLLADTAKAVQVQHLIYSSVGGAERNTGIPHFESKWSIEQHIRTLGLPATILRPTLFMDMFETFPFRTMILSMVSSFVRAEKAVQMIAADDIGAFAALAFAQPDKFIGQAVEIAGDALTPPQIRETVQRVKKAPAFYIPIPRFIRSRMPPELGLMMEWFDRAGYQADIPALRTLHPGLKTFADYLHTTNQ
jgi:uncharacterized protein YbjT (DUF2867 family)